MSLIKRMKEEARAVYNELKYRHFNPTDLRSGNYGTKVCFINKTYLAVTVHAQARELQNKTDLNKKLGRSRIM